MHGDYEGVKGRLLKDERIAKFVRMMPKDENYSLLQKSMEEKDYKTAFRAAHSLKGVSINLGLTPLAESAAALSDALRDGEPAPGADSVYEQVQKDYEMVVGIINRFSEAGGL